MLELFLLILSFFQKAFFGSPEKLPEVQEVPEEPPRGLAELPEDPKFPSGNKDCLEVRG